MAKIGDIVNFYFWHDGAMRTCTATITDLHPPDDQPQAIEADVDFPEEELSTGTMPHQSFSRQWSGTGSPSSQHDAGTWSQIN